jgi:ribosomal protein L23
LQCGRAPTVSLTVRITISAPVREKKRIFSRALVAKLPMPPRLYFPNFNLRLRFEPALRAEQKQLSKSTADTFRTRFIKLKTVPSLTRVEIKQILEKLYGLPVERVNTLNVYGKRRRYLGRYDWREQDFKYAYVRLAEEAEVPRDPRPPSSG